jgi:hypothetical protein
MVEGLRLYPWSPAARTEGRCPGERAATDTWGTGRRLSTAFAQGDGLCCTAAMAVVHRSIGGYHQEVVA